MSDLLDIALATAVPLWIDRHRDTPAEARIALARERAQVIAEHGDDILYRGAKRGDTASAFNALAEGLALAAFQPGGVKFRGQVWEA